MQNRTLRHEGATYSVSVGPTENRGHETDVWRDSHWQVERLAAEAARTVTVELIEPLPMVVEGKVASYCDRQITKLQVFDGAIHVVSLPSFLDDAAFATIGIARAAAVELAAETFVGAFGRARAAWARAA